jgi:hypothetical protein
MISRSVSVALRSLLSGVSSWAGSIAADTASRAHQYESRINPPLETQHANSDPPDRAQIRRWLCGDSVSRFFR